MDIGLQFLSQGAKELVYINSRNAIFYSYIIIDHLLNVHSILLHTKALLNGL